LHLSDFAYAASNYIAASRNLAHDVDNLKFYISRSQEILEDIVARKELDTGVTRDIPKPAEIDKVVEYRNAVVAANEDKKGGAQAVLMAAVYIQSVLQDIAASSTRLNYLKLLKTA